MNEMHRIKKHNSTVIGDRKHTHHHWLPFQNLPSLDIENSSGLPFIFALLSILIVVLVLCLTLLLIGRGLLIIWIRLLWIPTFPREMTGPSIIVTWITVTLGHWSTDTRNICLLWILVSCGRTDIWLLPGLELWRMIRRTIMIDWMIDYLLPLLISTKRSRWHTLFLLDLLMLPILFL